MTPEEMLEVRLLQQAARYSRWRWRAEVKRMRRRGAASPFAIHLCELRTTRIVWRELMLEAGIRNGPRTRAGRRVGLQFADRKCVAFLREHPNP